MFWKIKSPKCYKFKKVFACSVSLWTCYNVVMLKSDETLPPQGLDVSFKRCQQDVHDLVSLQRRGGSLKEILHLNMYICLITKGGYSVARPLLLGHGPVLICCAPVKSHVLNHFGKPAYFSHLTWWIKDLFWPKTWGELVNLVCSEAAQSC